MNAASVEMIMNLICEGVGVAKKISDLARRVKAGETISDEEILGARQSVEDAVSRWEDGK